jgi:heat-inducible transcriptional repressor
MSLLTPRQQTILNVIVSDHIRTAAPVPSESVARSEGLAVSPATVRSDVAYLEEAGYLTRPHPSAGSLPGDKAYRVYVESLVAPELYDIPWRVQWAVRKDLGEVARDVDEWTTVAATVLARLVGNMAIASFPKVKESRVRHIELIQLQDLLAMLIVVLEEARLSRQLIRLKRPMDTPELEASSNKVKRQVVGLTHREIESQVMDLTPLEEDLVEATSLILKEADRAAYHDHYVDGMHNLLSQPEFAENKRARAMVEGVEDGSLVEAVLAETPDGAIVRVTIGQENRGDMLWPLSVVICQYGVPNEAVGSVGAIGPTRMDYSKTIPRVKFMASVMSELVESVHSR